MKTPCQNILAWSNCVKSTRGWGVGLLAGLALLRANLTRSEMRAWMRQSALFAPKPQPGARTGRFARFCLWFVDQLFDQTAVPPTAPDERRGQ